MDKYKNTLLISPTTMKKYGVINLNLDDTMLGNAIRISQNVYLRDVIGDDLIDHLQDLVYNKIQGLDGDKIDDEGMIAYKTLLDDYITPVLVYRSAMEAATIATLKIRNMGLVKNTDANVNQTTSSDLDSIREYYGTFFNDAINRMMDFLCENKKAFVEIGDGFCTCSRKPLYGRTNLWLG